MTLKACLIASVMKGTEVVIKFSREHGYNVMVDEETIWWLVNQRQPGKPSGGNFEICKMLIRKEIGYKITTAEKAN